MKLTLSIQTVCKSQAPKCDECTLSAKGLCPSAELPKVKAKKTKKKVAAIEIAVEE